MLSTFVNFIIYSFGGCLLEMIYCTSMNLVYESRKCMLLGLLCPVYGIGATAVVNACEPIKKNKAAVFVIGAVFCSLAEYVTHIFYDVFLNVSFWDYTDRFFNINGRICAVYSVIWGLLSVIIVKYVHPSVAKLTKSIVKQKKLTAAMLAIFTADATVSAYLLSTFQTKHAVNLFMLLKLKT